MKMIPPSSLSAPPHPLLLMVVQPLMKLIKPITTILSIFVISSSPATALTSLHWMSRLGSASAFSISSKYVFVGHYPRRALAVPHFRSNKSSLSASAAPCRARRGGSPSLLVAADSSTSTTRQYTHQNNNLHSRSTKVSPVIAMQMLRGGGGGGKSSSSSRNSITNASTRKFDTWSFDKPCEDMEWTQPSSDRITFSNILSDSTEDGNGILNAAITESDLIIIGIMPPSSSSSSSALSNGDNDEEDGDDTEELLPPIELAGIAKHLNDLNVNGLLSQVANENAASFKNGAVLGCTTPVIRVASDGENVSDSVASFLIIVVGCSCLLLFFLCKNSRVFLCSS